MVGPSGMTGDVQVGSERYYIQPLGGGLHAVIDLDMSKVTGDDPPAAGGSAREMAPVSAALSAFGAGSASVVGLRPVRALPALSASNVLNLLVVYTGFAAATDTAIENTIQLHVDHLTRLCC